MKEKWYYNKWILRLMMFTIILAPLAIVLYCRKNGNFNLFVEYFESLSEDRFISFLWLILFLPYGLYRIHKCDSISKNEVKIVHWVLFILIARGILIDNPEQLKKINASSNIVTLEEGTYEVGDDYDSGNYQLSVISGSGAITLNSTGRKTQSIELNKESKPEKVTLMVGDELKVSGSLKVNAMDEGDEDEAKKLD